MIYPNKSYINMIHHTLYILHKYMQRIYIYLLHRICPMIFMIFAQDMLICKAVFTMTCASVFLVLYTKRFCIFRYIGAASYRCYLKSIRGDSVSFVLPAGGTFQHSLGGRSAVGGWWLSASRKCLWRALRACLPTRDPRLATWVFCPRARWLGGTVQV